MVRGRLPFGQDPSHRGPTGLSGGRDSTRVVPDEVGEDSTTHESRVRDWTHVMGYGTPHGSGPTDDIPHPFRGKPGTGVSHPVNPDGSSMTRSRDEADPGVLRSASGS